MFRNMHVAKREKKKKDLEYRVKREVTYVVLFRKRHSILNFFFLRARDERGETLRKA